MSFGQCSRITATTQSANLFRDKLVFPLPRFGLFRLGWKEEWRKGILMTPLKLEVSCVDFSITHDSR